MTAAKRAIASSLPAEASRTRESRIEQGRKARERLARGKLGELPAQRPGDCLETLTAAQADRVPKLLPVKYQRMAVSAFAFFRGAVSLMAADLAVQPHTDLRVQLCGDAHLQNLGSFETPDGHIVFDINDFDETIPGPWEWDVKRMATSIVLAGEDAGHNASSRKQAVREFLEAYIHGIEDAAEQPILVAARRQIHRLKDCSVVSAAFKQAQRATPLELRAKYTEKNGHGKYVFKAVDHTLWRVAGDERAAVLAGMAQYLRTLAPDRLHLFDFFSPRDVAFKIVGTGSVGLRDYVILMEGNGPKDPLFLQIKQEVPSAYAPYLKQPPADHQGQRVADGQRRIQPVSDLLLGWTRVNGHDYLVRQLNDHKGSIDIENLRGNGLPNLSTVAGNLLARGHARSGDAVAIQSYLGTGEKAFEALAKFADDYAGIVADDYKKFCKAIDDGRFKTAA